MLELCFEMGKIIVGISLAVGFIFAALVGLVLLAGWVWDKIERLWNER